MFKNDCVKSYIFTCHKVISQHVHNTFITYSQYVHILFIICSNIVHNYAHNSIQLSIQSNPTLHNPLQSPFNRFHTWTQYNSHAYNKSPVQRHINAHKAIPWSYNSSSIPLYKLYIITYINYTIQIIQTIYKI